MKKCFTINESRTTEDILSYETLLENNIYQAIEIFYPYNLDDVKFQLYTNNLRNLKTKFPNLEMVMHLPHGKNNNLCHLSNFLEVVKMMKAAIDYANQFSIIKLTLHLGYANLNREFDLNHIVIILKDLCDYAKKYQMQLMIENMPSTKLIASSPKEILSIIKLVNKDNLKFILDTGHAFLSGYSIEDYLDTLKDYLYHLHYNDNQGVKDEHNRLGKGKIDFRNMIKKLKSINYQELHCLEILFNNVNDLISNANDLDAFDKN